MKGYVEEYELLSLCSWHGTPFLAPKRIPAQVDGLSIALRPRPKIEMFPLLELLKGERQ